MFIATLFIIAKVKTTKISLDRWMAKQTVKQPCNRILLSINKKKWTMKP